MCHIYSLWCPRMSMYHLYVYQTIMAGHVPIASGTHLSDIPIYIYACVCKMYKHSIITLLYKQTYKQYILVCYIQHLTIHFKLTRWILYPHLTPAQAAYARSLKCAAGLILCYTLRWNVHSGTRLWSISITTLQSTSSLLSLQAYYKAIIYL